MACDNSNYPAGTYTVTAKKDGINDPTLSGTLVLGPSTTQGNTFKGISINPTTWQPANDPTQCVLGFNYSNDGYANGLYVPAAGTNGAGFAGGTIAVPSIQGDPTYTWTAMAEESQVKAAQR